jgi:hypothetical protein
MVELASGVDALYLSGRASLRSALVERLEQRRRLAEGASIAIPCEIGNVRFGMAPHAWGMYRYCLDHETTRLGFTTSERLPAIRIQPRSQYLHSTGPAGAVARFHEVLGAECGDLSFTVSRVDLYADWQAWSLSADDRHRFLCRGDAVRTYEAGGRFTGFEFGSGGPRRARPESTTRPWTCSAPAPTVAGGLG